MNNKFKFGFYVRNGDVDFLDVNCYIDVDGDEVGDFGVEVDICFEVIYVEFDVVDWEFRNVEIDVRGIVFWGLRGGGGGGCFVVVVFVWSSGWGGSLRVGCCGWWGCFCVGFGSGFWWWCWFGRFGLCSWESDE